MNLNFGQKPEYELHSSMINEVINMYGIEVKLVLQERVNNDQVVFGDRSHLFTDGEHAHTMYMLPENPEEFDEMDYGFSSFGLEGLNTVNLFVHKNSIEDLPGVEPINQGSRDYTQKMKSTIQDMDYHLIGHLVVLPSGKIMEITDQQYEVPGINNIYQSKNQKSVYKISTVSYRPKLHDELDEMDISTLGQEVDSVDQLIPDKSLEDYFDELSDIKLDQEFESEVNDTASRVIQDGDCLVQDVLKTSIVDTSEKAPWE